MRGELQARQKIGREPGQRQRDKFSPCPDKRDKRDEETVRKCRQKLTFTVRVSFEHSLGGTQMQQRHY